MEYGVWSMEYGVCIFTRIGTGIKDEAPRVLSAAGFYMGMLHHNNNTRLGRAAFGIIKGTCS